ncbi:MAG TPA: hypothetical protein ENK85_03445 [Saprospiraceae bacterium]|nr:hypothetical protein [Saprospiraceae bacterium]
MKDNKAAVIGLLVVLVLGTFIASRFMGKKYSWSERYTERSKDPYTLYLAGKILKDYYPNHRFFKVTRNFSQTLKKQHHAGGNYLFFGRYYYITDRGVDSLLNFVADGHTAFIATKELPYRLIFKLFGDDDFCESEDYTGEEAVFSSSVNINLIHPKLKLDKGLPVEIMGQYDPKIHRWNYIPTQYICDSGIHAAGTINDRFVDFGYIPYGKGRFYFHTNPIVFTNYFLMRRDGKEYFDGIMAHLGADNIYYDIAARKPVFDHTNNRQPRGRRPNFGQEGPLTYILSQKSLAIAWYLLLFMALAYLAFRSKRKQRIIPIIEKNENTSLIFIQNISNLYFQQGNNKQLCLQKFIHFQDFVRTKYALNFKNNQTDFAARLAQKSGIPEAKIKEIITIHQNINNSTFLSDSTLTKFHLAINHFYQNCK